MSKISLFVPLLVLGLVLAGSINSLAVKYQDDTNDPYDGNHPFFHPYFQAFLMFVAEFLCLGAFYFGLKFSAQFEEEFTKGKSVAMAKGLNPEPSFAIPLIPACCDITATTMQYISLNYINPSIYVMVRGGLPITTAIFSVIFLKKKLFGHHILGLSSVVIGIGLFGYVEVNSASGSSPNAVAGFIFVLASLLGTAAQFVIEEKIFEKNYFHPLRMVGLEGFWGLFLSTTMVIITSYIPCGDPTSDTCNQGYLENAPNALKAIFTNGLLFLYVMLTMLSLSVFNFCGVSITKHVSSLARSLISITVTVVVWVYSLIFMNDEFYFLQLVGFVFVVFGNLVYQEVLEIPGFKENTKKNREAKKLRDEYDEMQS